MSWAACTPITPTGPHLIAAEKLPPPDLVVNRALRRRNEIGRLWNGWPPAPAAAWLLPIAAPLNRGSLLHLDVRRANIRCHDGRVGALLDWSNALQADPLLEFGRLTEFARLPENQLNMTDLRAGYAVHAEPPPHTGPLALLCQLDAAVMLALVFLSESPDPAQAEAAVSRVLQLRERLDR
ncbi:MAG: phosphotransferase [Actinomycetota bacterium]|nr:phosphotransferase [Actinomycetota bacterium]